MNTALEKLKTVPTTQRGKRQDMGSRISL